MVQFEYQFRGVSNYDKVRLSKAIELNWRHSSNPVPVKCGTVGISISRCSKFPPLLDSEVCQISMTKFDYQKPSNSIDVILQIRFLSSVAQLEYQFRGAPNFHHFLIAPSIDAIWDGCRTEGYYKWDWMGWVGLEIRRGQGGRSWGTAGPRKGLLWKEGPPTYAILLWNSVLSWFTCFLKGFCRALNESHPAFVQHSTKVIQLS